MRAKLRTGESSYLNCDPALPQGQDFSRELDSGRRLMANGTDPESEGEFRSEVERRSGTDRRQPRSSFLQRIWKVRERRRGDERRSGQDRRSPPAEDAPLRSD